MRRLCPSDFKIERWPHRTYDEYMNWVARRRIDGFDAIVVSRETWEALHDA